MTASVGRRPGKAAQTLAEAWRRDVAVSDAGACWLWTGPVSSTGYGRVCFGGQRLYAHRVAVILHGRSIPTGYVIDHLCRTPICCNPSHLDIVTIAENTARGVSPGATAVRTGACRRGHDLANAYVTGDRRQCRPCLLDRARTRRAVVAP